MNNFKYWNVRLRDDVIVVEWAADGVIYRTEGLFVERGGYPHMAWLYDKPPEDIDRACLTIFARNDEHDVEGADPMGTIVANDVDDFVCAAGSEVA